MSYRHKILDLFLLLGENHLIAELHNTILDNWNHSRDGNPCLITEYSIYLAIR